MNEKLTQQLVDLLNEKVLRLSNAYDRVCKENRRLQRENKKLVFVIDELHIHELLNGDGTPNYDAKGGNNGENNI